MATQDYPPGAVKGPSPAELFTPKLVTVLREGLWRKRPPGRRPRRADRRHRGAAAVDGHRHRLRRRTRARAVHRDHRRLPDLGARRQPLPDRRTGRARSPSSSRAPWRRHGIDGMLLATAMAGVFLLLIGALRLGSYIKYIPYPVTVGFISGIAVILLVGQAERFPRADGSRRIRRTSCRSSRRWRRRCRRSTPSAVAVSLATVAIIVALRRFAPALPGILIAVVTRRRRRVAAEAADRDHRHAVRRHPAARCRRRRCRRFRSRSCRRCCPTRSPSRCSAAIESPAFGDGRRRHDRAAASLQHANSWRRASPTSASALFGGIPATGTIARTATNVRAGARGPAGRACSTPAFILLFMLVAAPLASFIPLAGLAGVLVVVAWNMAEKHAFVTLIRTSAATRWCCSRPSGSRCSSGWRRPSLSASRSARCCSCTAWRRRRVSRRMFRPSPRTRPTTTADRTLRPGAGSRSRHRRLPDLRRLLLRRRRDGRIGARPYRRPAQGLRHRLLGGAVHQFHGRQHHRGRASQGEAERRPRSDLRGVPANAPDPRLPRRA